MISKLSAFLDKQAAAERPRSFRDSLAASLLSSALPFGSTVHGAMKGGEGNRLEGALRGAAGGTLGAVGGYHIGDTLVGSPLARWIGALGGGTLGHYLATKGLSPQPQQQKEVIAFEKEAHELIKTAANVDAASYRDLHHP